MFYNIQKKPLKIAEIEGIQNTDIDQALYPMGLKLKTKKQSLTLCFQHHIDRMNFSVALMCLSSSNPTIRGFVNPGISILHFCVLSRGKLKQEHPDYGRILENIDAFR